MTIEAGKLSPIIDDDPLLSPIWKGKIDPRGTTLTRSSFGASSGSGVDNGNADVQKPVGARPSLSDIVKPIKLETYYDASGMQMAKATIRIYNSSGEDLEKFAVMLTLSDKQGGTA